MHLLQISSPPYILLFTKKSVSHMKEVDRSTQKININVYSRFYYTFSLSYFDAIWENNTYMTLT